MTFVFNGFWLFNCHASFWDLCERFAVLRRSGTAGALFFLSIDTCSESVILCFLANINYCESLALYVYMVWQTINLLSLAIIKDLLSWCKKRVNSTLGYCWLSFNLYIQYPSFKCLATQQLQVHIRICLDVNMFFVFLYLSVEVGILMVLLYMYIHIFIC